ncbi:MAG: hypothetical protein ABI131_01565, partial [Nostocoides sp.]
MAPNGLIFLVVVAIWAAYLVQYWIRRREHLATARSMDRFSESMRVLARRSPLPKSSLETPAPRSYAVSPARSMRPQVLVKRAGVTASTSLMASHPAGSSDSASPGRSPRPAGSGRATDDMPSTAVPRRVRGLVLLAQLGVFLVVTVLAVVGAVVWWAPFLAVLAIGCAVVWVGRGVRAQRVAARTAYRHQPVRRPASRPTARPAVARRKV